MNNVPTPASSVHSLVTYDHDDSDEDIERTDVLEEVAVSFQHEDPFSDDEDHTSSAAPSPKMKAPTAPVSMKKPKMQSGISLVSYGFAEDDDEEPSLLVDDELGVQGDLSTHVEEEEKEEVTETKTEVDTVGVKDLEDDAMVISPAEEVLVTSDGEGEIKEDETTEDPSKASGSPPPAPAANTGTRGSSPVHGLHSGTRKRPNDEASSLARSVQNLAADEIELPPEPAGRCSVELQQKVVQIMERAANRGNFDLNQQMQDNKAFRNPSMYDKLITFLNVDEKGTNFPSSVYDPYIWGMDSFYDELAKTQNREMEKREKDRKEQKKMEFVTAGGKPAASILPTKVDISDTKKRSKWDSAPQKAPTIPSSTVPVKQSNQDPLKTSISAVGSLLKKKK